MAVGALRSDAEPFELDALPREHHGLGTASVGPKPDSRLRTPDPASLDSAGFRPRRSAAISYTDSTGTFADGSQYTLRVPHYTLTGGYVACRVASCSRRASAPVVFGLGLLEAVPEWSVLAMADPSDRNRDGVSGRAELRVGRSQAASRARPLRLEGQRAQSAAADRGRIQRRHGHHVDDLSRRSRARADAYPGCAAHAPEIDPQLVQAVAFYTQTLGVPARRDLDDPTAQQGERLFYAAGCNGCHVPTLRTGVPPGRARGVEPGDSPVHRSPASRHGAALADGRRTSWRRAASGARRRSGVSV